MTPISLPELLSPADLRAMPRATARDAAGARAAGLAFEEMFLAQMLGPVFDSLPTDGPFGGGTGEQMFRSFQVNEYAKAIVRAGGIGLADAVTREIIALQEQANG